MPRRTSCFAYVFLGLIAGPHFGNYEAGFQLGQLGYELVERRRLHRYQARTYMAFGNLVMPWTKHVRTGRDLVRRAFDAANKAGDLTFAAYCRNNLNTNLLAAGDRLADAQREAEQGLDFAQKARFGLVIDIITAQLGLIRMLRGLTPTFGSLDHEQFDERRFEGHLASQPDLALPECWYWIRKLQARVLAGDYGSAIDAASKAQPLLWTSPSFFETAEYEFYGGLARAGFCNSIPSEERPQQLAALSGHHRQLAIWASHCPENFENRAALVGAEIARIDSRVVDAEQLYEQAIRSAHEHGFVQNEGLAYELAARFYMARGFEDIAHLYLRRARRCYGRWGADGKVRQLDERYPRLREEEPASDSRATIGEPVERLELATVLRVLQAVSGEMVLEKLVDTVLRTAIEHAGADRGVLIVPRGDELRIEAEGRTTGSTIAVSVREMPISSATVPESVVRYAARAQESVSLDDASTRGGFENDDYVRREHALSVLCLPLLQKGQLMAVLYLENNLATGVFTRARMAVLNVLASQAAMALEKSRLYGELQQREAKIRRLVDANIIGIFIWELDGRILEANDAFLSMLGYDREDLVAGRLQWTDLTPPEWRDPDVRRWIPELKVSGTLQPFEKEYFRKDGSRVPVLIGVAAFEESGNQGAAFVLDLTERKRAEQSLRESEREARLVVGAIPGCIAVMSREGEIEFVNQQVLAYFGRTLEDLKGWTMSDAVHRDERPRLVSLWARAMETGEPYEMESRLRRADGAYRWFHSHAVPLRDEEGRVVRWYVLMTDIDDRKCAEAALREAHSELAHVARVTTMGELTASIAHEVKQPIAAAVTSAQTALRWLEAQPPDLGEVREALSRIVRAGKRAGDVIGRIRALVTKAPTRKDSLEINAAIREVVELTRGEAVKNGVSLRADLAEGVPLIQGDRVQLQQVMLNLIINGIEAMTGDGEAPRDLLVSSKRDDAGGVLVGVADTGPGLAAGALEQVFAAFYTTKPGGLGLGLSICHSIIEAHDGRLWASANELRGTVFQFSLPPAERPAGALEAR